MTPQERQLIDELFERLASLENNPRDADAERAIADGLRRAPHATYALVQTALVQDEALKRANARIEDLQAQLDGAEPPRQQQGSFLDSMRDVFGRGEARGSVPNVRPQAPQSQGYAPAAVPPGYPPQAYPPGGPGFGSGGSFLGTAASTAAGVIGGALLLDGIRSMFGHHAGFGGNDTNAFGDTAGAGSGGGGAGLDQLDQRLNQLDQTGDTRTADQDANMVNGDDDIADDSDFANDDDFTGDDGGFDDGGSDYA
jgi:uncharacterized protein